jgi:hypothetical protein
MCVELSEVAHYRGWPTSLGVNLQSTSGTILPEIYAYAADGTTSVDTSIKNFTEGLGYGSAVPTIQWSQAVRVDLLPANTTIKPSYYGFNTSGKPS